MVRCRGVALRLGSRFSGEQIAREWPYRGARTGPMGRRLRKAAGEPAALSVPGWRRSVGYSASHQSPMFHWPDAVDGLPVKLRSLGLTSQTSLRR